MRLQMIPPTREPTKRLSVLMSAYACEPGKGSEPEVGWRWALQMARFHDVTVLTRANNRKAIEASLPVATALAGTLRFVYHDLSTTALYLKKHLPFSIWYYLAWQISARQTIRRLLNRDRYDLLHHVTYAAIRYSTAVSGHGIPTLWGPVGGIEETPWLLLEPRYPGPSLGEACRNLANRIEASGLGLLRRRAKRHTTVIASTRETQECLARMGIESPLLTAIGLPATALPPARTSSNTLNLLYVGNMLFLKGLHLALHALADSGTTATFTLFGDGPFRSSLQQLATSLGLGSRVIFRGRQPQEAVLAAYGEFDAFLFPSFHDSGAFAVLEAMSQGLPVICLDRGGPALAVRPNCGWKITPRRRAQTIHDLAEAIRAADRDRKELALKGKAARASVIQHYDWDVQGDAMNVIYHNSVNPVAIDPRREFLSP